MNESFTPDGRDERWADTLTDELRFRETLSLAQRVCVGRELPPVEYEPSWDPEAKVIATLGLTGLRHAIDESAHTPKIITAIGMNHTPNHSGDLIVPHPVESPELYSDGVNPEIAAEAEQLGEQLLATAYRCLGQDVHDRIRELKSAATQGEQLQTLDWLKGRLNALYAHKNDEENVTADMVNYHPMRLSPEIIGTYPHTNVDPTCLSVSVIAASFFEQAGLPHLHAGVMQTTTEQEQMTAADKLADITIDYARASLDGPIPWLDEYGFHNSIFPLEMARYFATRPESTHASNLVKLHDGWALLDANFHVLAALESSDSQQVDRMCKDLAQLHPIAPGLELTYYSQRPILNQQAFYPSYCNDSRDLEADRNTSPQKYRDILIEQTESVFEKLYQVQAAPTRHYLQTNEHVEPHIREYQLQAYDSMSRKSFYTHLEAYALQNQPIDEVQARCRTDYQYLLRRTSDIHNIWLMVEDDVNEEARRMASDDQLSSPHAALEVGLPALRIGFSVLKEFDTYFDNGTSLSFWVNNWASRIASSQMIAEATPPDPNPLATPMRRDPQFESELQDIIDNIIPHRPETTPRSGQHELAELHAKLLCATGLHYGKDTDIIRKFLQSTERNENNEAHQAEEAR